MAIAGLTLSLAVTLPAQTGSTSKSSASPDSAYSQQEMRDLLEPIALYPDALIALILPAATMPADITLAARFLRDGGSEDQIDSQPWDDSVKSLARYPEVIEWMDENLEWTASLGDAFVSQPTEVMNTMQGLREKARLAGNLKDTPQQTIVEEVVAERTYIRIVPTEPNVIYIPSYDPQIVYYATPSYFVGSVISYSVGFVCGPWLTYDCDWRRQEIYCGSSRPDWNNRGRAYGDRSHVVGNSNNVNINSPSAQLWNPSSQSRSRTDRRNDARQYQNGSSSLPAPQRLTTTQGQNGSNRQAAASPSFPANGQSSRPIRVDPPLVGNLTTGNRTITSPPQGEFPTRDARVQNQNLGVGATQGMTTAPVPSRRNSARSSVSANATRISTSREGNRVQDSSASNPSQTISTLPVGIDRSRIHAVQPSATSTLRPSTGNVLSVNPSSSTSSSPASTGVSRFQSTGANVPSTAGFGVRSSGGQTTIQGQGQVQSIPPSQGTSGRIRSR